ncbi:MAG: histidine--tRNA ligase [Acidobacteria bacterium]|nr:histidine--tRNA ligase [Acidobacteriota bacterium]
MAEAKKFRAIKGVRDILPPESALWNRVEQTARDVFATFGFQEIRLPIFEQTELFARSVGVNTDIVGKEMYSFADRDDTSISLRPEATASVVRAYIEHGMHSRPGDVKLYYMGPMFRRERPQKGRYRQFYQIGAEVLGQSDQPAIDAEVLEMLMVYLERLGLVGAKLHLNSIGCQECRPKYVEKLREALLEVINELGADSQRRIETNPLRVLDSKTPDEQAIIEKLPRIGDHLCASCRDHFAQVQQQLKQRGIAYEINWRLVRGLDYYMRTTFEITAPGLGAQNAICGGGRYDGLVELLGGPPTKGIGFAIGTDRLVLALQEVGAGDVKAEVRKDVTVPVTGVVLKAEVGRVKVEVGIDVFVAWMGAASQPAAVKIVRKLREAGLSVEVPAEEMKFKKSIGLAAKLGARFALIIGENELKEGKYALKRLADGHQESLSEADLLAQLKAAQA